MDSRAGQMMITERLGRIHSVRASGYFFSIPLIDKIRFVIDMREKALAIEPQKSITKDNVHVSVSGNVFFRFVDATKAAYGSMDPLYSVDQHAQSAMRAAIGEMELDEILHARVKLNESIRAAISPAADQWGVEIKRYEITEISSDRHITEVCP
jgi:regulator of protease activity HflC (stomatin/prohibitin superfamily)